MVEVLIPFSSGDGLLSLLVGDGARPGLVFPSQGSRKNSVEVRLAADTSREMGGKSVSDMAARLEAK